MKTLNASFIDLNGKVINIETEEQLETQIDFALWNINTQSAPSTLPKEHKDKIITYWQHRLECLEAIKKENTKNTSTPQIESITVYLLLAKKSNIPCYAFLDETIANEKATDKFNVMPLILNTDSDIYTIQDLQGHINKDVNFSK